MLAPPTAIEPRVIANPEDRLDQMIDEIERS